MSILNSFIATKLCDLKIIGLKSDGYKERILETKIYVDYIFGNKLFGTYIETAKSMAL